MPVASSAQQEPQVGYSDQTLRQRSRIQGAAGDYGTVSCRCRRAHAPRQPRQLSDVDGDLPRLFAREQVVSCRLAALLAETDTGPRPAILIANHKAGIGLVNRPARRDQQT